MTGRKSVYVAQSAKDSYTRQEIDEMLRNERVAIHFRKDSEYTILDDSPVLGAYERVFKSSEIIGPLLEEPALLPSTDYLTQEAITRLFLPGRIPSFEEWELQTYTVDPSKAYLWEFDRGLLETVSADILQRLERAGVRKEEERCSFFSPQIMVDVEFYGWETPVLRSVTQWRKQGAPAPFHLDVRRVEQAFRSYNWDIACKHAIRRGLAFEYSPKMGDPQPLTGHSNIIL